MKLGVGEAARTRMRLRPPDGLHTACGVSCQLHDRTRWSQIWCHRIYSTYFSSYPFILNIIYAYPSSMGPTLSQSCTSIALAVSAAVCLLRNWQAYFLHPGRGMHG